ncbi:MAG: SIS domain-containing protein [Candidatus Velthaea sp.]
MDAVAQYLEELQSALAAISRDDIRFVVEALANLWLTEGTAFLVGNGGSASTASHMMNDLCKFTAFEGRRPLRAMALTDNVPLMTAYGNDVSFETIFVEPLRAFMRSGDMLIALSGSGNSPNVIAACRYAIQHGATVIGLCGSPGGLLAQIAHHRVIVPAERIGQQEDGHLVLNHVIATALRERIAALTGQAAVAVH